MHARDRKVDYSLKLCREVLKLPAFHFGYFENPGSRQPVQWTIEDLKQAQHKYTEKLLGHVPPSVKTVLDVGCGTGIAAGVLVAKGYSVECLSPDLYNQEVINMEFEGKVKFHLAKFEEYETNKKYDLILMSESSQYIKLDRIFEKAGQLLESGGHLLLSDYFRKEPVRYYRNCKVLRDFLKKAEDSGFAIVEEEDITDNVLPTFMIGSVIYKTYLTPIVEALVGLAKDEIPKLSKVIKFFFRKKLGKLEKNIYQDYPEYLSAEKFKKEIRYMIYMFRKN